MEAAYTSIPYELLEPYIARVTLDREKQLNAYTATLCRELCDALERY